MANGIDFNPQPAQNPLDSLLGGFGQGLGLAQSMQAMRENRQRNALYQRQLQLEDQRMRAAQEEAAQEQRKKKLIAISEYINQPFFFKLAKKDQEPYISAYSKELGAYTGAQLPTDINYEDLDMNKLKKASARVGDLLKSKGVTRQQIGSVVAEELPNLTKEQASQLIELAEFSSEAPKQNLTTAQTAVDKAFAKEYVDYMASGGFADTMTQINGLEEVLKDLKSGEFNLTGPVVGTPPMLARKVLNQKSVAAQQTVEQSVQRALKKTLGAQFTQREGELFMQRGYDTQLKEEENVKKLERAISQLKIMARAKQEAVDYFEKNGTLRGYKGKLYMLKDGEMVEATKDQFYSILSDPAGSKVKIEENALKEQGLIED